MFNHSERRDRPTIRAPQADELPRLQEIEVAAGCAFATIGMTVIADDDPPSLERLEHYRRNGHAWVHTDRNDVPSLTSSPMWSTRAPTSSRCRSIPWLPGVGSVVR